MAGLIGGGPKTVLRIGNHLCEPRRSQEFFERLEWRSGTAADEYFERLLHFGRSGGSFGEQFVQLWNRNRIDQRGASRLKFSNCFVENRGYLGEVRRLGFRSGAHRLAEDTDARSSQAVLIE